MPPHTPSESEILTSYLLHPSPLPTILPYKSFLALVPPSASSSARQHPTELKRLYRDLQFQRDIVIDDVRRRIEDERRRSVELTARLGRQIRREEEGLRRGRKRKRKEGSARGDDGDDGDDDEKSDSDVDKEEQETQFDTALHDGRALGNTLPTATAKHNHTATTLLAAMATAGEDLTAEIADLEAQIDALRTQAKDTIGNLSDLRYGRFAMSSGRMSGDRKSSGTTTTDTDTAKTRNELLDEFKDDMVAAIKELKDNLVKAMS
ncbi:hypothetical protein CLAIMM_09631 [Cladophialophora immunda]|nr:hypothetical protein CLAIMM_09631 [Cladophialophora immunda]